MSIIVTYVFGVFIAFIVGYIAKEKNHSFWGWFIFALLLPIISLIIIMIIPPETPVKQEKLKQKKKINIQTPLSAYRMRNQEDFIFVKNQIIEKYKNNGFNFILSNGGSELKIQNKDGNIISLDINTKMKNNILFLYSNIDVPSLQNMEKLSSDFIKTYIFLTENNLNTLKEKINYILSSLKNENEIIELIHYVMSEEGYTLKGRQGHQLIYIKKISSFKTITFPINLRKQEPDNENEKTFLNVYDLISSQYNSIIAIMSILAKSDSIISQQEADYIQIVIDDFIADAKALKFSDDQLKQLRNEMISTYKNEKNKFSKIKSYANNLVLKHDQLFMYFNKFVELSKIDGLTVSKRNLLIEISQIFKIPDEAVKNLLNDLDENKKEFDPYEILKCSPSDNLNTIKQKYKQLIKKFHPDYLQGKDLDEEFILFAEEKVKLLNKAFDMIKKEKS